MYRISAILVLLIAFSCVQLKQQTLYDGTEPEEKIEKPKTIALAVEPLIYDESTKDMWGIEKDVCKEVRISDSIAYESEQSIFLEWDRNSEGCDWAGIGIGWDSYAGKDLTEVMDFAAIQFYVRTKEGRAFGLPIVLTLEDYSGGMGFCYTSNKYFERTTIDEKWQKVVVPLNDFDLETENLDITNIKQLQLELQQSGKVYIDQIRIVFYTPEKVEPWLEEEERPDPVNFPIIVFDDQFINENGWGMMKDDCQDFSVSSENGQSENKVIHAKWNNEDCHLLAFGASWNFWYPVNISELIKTGAIQFDVKNLKPGTSPSFRFGFEDYDRAKSTIKVTPEMADRSSFNDEWNTVTIPFSELKEPIDFSRIKHLLFSMDGDGELLFDNIQLINLSQ